MVQSVVVEGSLEVAADTVFVVAAAVAFEIVLDTVVALALA